MQLSARLLRGVARCVGFAGWVDDGSKPLPLPPSRKGRGRDSNWYLPACLPPARLLLLAALGYVGGSMPGARP
jgi:hypothetical protein